MKRVFKILNILISIMLVVIAAGVVFIAFPQFGNQALIVRSGSMAPTIDVGSIVVAKANSQDLISPLYETAPLYNRDDIIAFRSEKNSNTIISHRIVGVKPLKEGGVYYQTKGDANDSIDGWQVNQQNILGKVYFSIPFIGQLLAFAKSDLGFPLLIILPALAVIFLELITIIKEIRKKRKENFEIRYIKLTQESFLDKLRFLRPNLLSFKILIPLLIFSLAIPSSLAFFSDTETSTGNTFTAAASFPQTSNLFVSDGYTCPGGASDTAVSKGTVTISKDSSLDITVTLTGALPSTSYDLWVNQDPGACPLSSPTVSVFITTDGSGNGTNTLNDHPLVGTATKFWVSMVGGSDVLRSTAVSF